MYSVFQLIGRKWTRVYVTPMDKATAEQLARGLALMLPAARFIARKVG